MEFRFFGQGKSLVRMLTLPILALAIALVGVAQTVNPAYADGGGTAGGYVSNTPLTAQQQKQLDAKNPDPINTTDVGSVR